MQSSAGYATKVALKLRLPHVGVTSGAVGVVKHRLGIDPRTGLVVLSGRDEGTYDGTQPKRVPKSKAVFVSCAAMSPPQLVRM